MSDSFMITNEVLDQKLKSGETGILRKLNLEKAFWSVKLNLFNWIIEEDELWEINE